LIGNFFPLILYIGLIIVFSLIKFPAIENKTLNFFKAFFPSWKFFDESVNTPVLLIRTQYNETLSDWQVAYPPPKTKWFHFLLNPQGNFYLAFHSHIQQLLGELTLCDEEETKKFHTLVTYKTTVNFARFKVLQLTAEAKYFQFKISNIEYIDNFNFQVLDDILISPITGVNE
jgi:hypothetical protein